MSSPDGRFDYTRHCLVVVNRGEIALRIFRTAKALGIRTVAVHTLSDTRAPHVLFADDAVALPVLSEEGTENSEASAYLSVQTIVSVILEYNANHESCPITLVHPGYGFLSENATLASQICIKTGATWVGPCAKVIADMGLKHVARQAAIRAGVPVVPGSEGLLGSNSDQVLDVANHIGLPVILKATAGGGGMAMAICYNEEQILREFERVKERAKVLFSEEGVFLEKYLPTARHIEIQVFGNGLGDVVHLAERECSIQRRHQKVIEETPSPFLEANEGLREQICDAAVALCREIKYGSAGTVEFIVDDQSGQFFFLEMNTRIQVEHPITEEIHPGLDLIRLMLQQSILERDSSSKGFTSQSPEMQQSYYDQLRTKGRNDGLHGHAIEGRLYAENPADNFAPSPGLLQYVSLPLNEIGIRIETWIATGTIVTPFFDPLLCKLIVIGKDRENARRRFLKALEKCIISGPPVNKGYLAEIANSDFFKAGKTLTTSLNQFTYTPRALKILSPGLDMSVQDFPGRTIGLGIPRSGPMDELAFRVGNILVGNPQGLEGIEMVLLPGMPPVSIMFFCKAIIAVTGRDVIVSTDEKPQQSWSQIVIPENTTLKIQARAPINGHDALGFRVYICIYGGFPGISPYLGSKSTSLGLGGYQGRTLASGDQLDLEDLAHQIQVSAVNMAALSLQVEDRNSYNLPYILSIPFHSLRSLFRYVSLSPFTSIYSTFKRLVNSPSPFPPVSSFHRRMPKYPQFWVIHVLPGPYDDPEYVKQEGIEKFYNTKWIITASSNRMGIRLQSSDGSKLEWARTSGGEGGSHPSNILDNAYTLATVNINGDTPVILTNEGPDMGGYLCLCTVASAERWKLGQLSPGSIIQFSRIRWSEAMELRKQMDQDLSKLEKNKAVNYFLVQDLKNHKVPDTPYSPVLHVKVKTNDIATSKVIFRQAGDEAILVEFGEMRLDFTIRAHIHAFQNAILKSNPSGLRLLCPCIRSIMCYYDPIKITQFNFLKILTDIEALVPDSVTDMTFPGRRITLPIVLDDRWNREALEKYMQSIRDKAVYLPSNIQYLADNNGFESSSKALERLVQSDWLVFGVGFYLACPFLVPIDPRCRLEGQKMNPSRTYTPRGAIGIAGPVAAIYPTESPGGYQLYGRTLPLWQTWGKGVDYDTEKPWLLQPFDQIHFEPIDEEEYLKLERQFDAGVYKFKMESSVFAMSDYARFIESIKMDVSIFRRKQAEAKSITEAKEKELLAVWEREREESKSQPMLILDDQNSELVIKATLFASVWKIECSPRQIIASVDQILLVLEAMKTEIPVCAGEEFLGKKIKGFGKGIKIGATVCPGDVLVVLDPDPLLTSD